MSSTTDLESLVWDEKQQRAIDAAIAGKNLFLSGPGGTGKTAVLMASINALKALGRHVVILTPTGITAVDIGGVTVHKGFNLPAGPCVTEKGKLMVHLPKWLPDVDVIIIDEGSMVRLDVFDSVIEAIRKVEKKTGRNIQLIFSADFYQLPPVLTKETGEHLLLEKHYGSLPTNLYPFLSSYWNALGFTTVLLDTPFRQNDHEFIIYLNRLRSGDNSQEVLDYFNQALHHDPKFGAIRMYPTNSEVERYNAECMRRLEGMEYAFTVICGPGLAEDSVPKDHRVRTLKKGTRIMFTSNCCNGRYCEAPLEDAKPSHVKRRNRNYYVNGSFGTVLDVDLSSGEPLDHFLTIQVDDGPVIMLYRQTYNVVEYVVVDDGSIAKQLKGSYYQFPIKLAYAVTIHKSQGQTLDAVRIDPRSFAPGMMYVALSRVRSFENLYLERPLTRSDIQVDPLVVEFYDRLDHQRSDPPPGQDPSGGTGPTGGGCPPDTDEDCVPTVSGTVWTYSDYQFEARKCMLKDEKGDRVSYYRIVLVHTEAGVIVADTGYEWYVDTPDSILTDAETTRRKKVYIIMESLNYLLHECGITKISQMTPADFRKLYSWYKTLGEKGVRIEA